MRWLSVMSAASCPVNVDVTLVIEMSIEMKMPFERFRC